MIKVIACDLFGTLADPSGVPLEEKQAYVKRFTAKVYETMKLPVSWRHIPTFPDTKTGIQLLRTKYRVVTCSNWDYVTTWNWLRNNEIEVDDIIELRDISAYKPKLITYAHICDVMEVDPSEVLFVTGNKGGPDNMGAPEKIGMKSILIRNGWPNDLIELAGEII